MTRERGQQSFKIRHLEGRERAAPARAAQFVGETGESHGFFQNADRPESFRFSLIEGAVDIFLVGLDDGVAIPIG